MLSLWLGGADAMRSIETSDVHHAHRRSGCVAVGGACAAARSDAADRRADGLRGERSGRAILACGVSECAHAAGVVGRQQSSNRVRWGAADLDRIRTLAKELVDLRPDAIFNQT